MIIKVIVLLFNNKYKKINKKNSILFEIWQEKINKNIKMC